MWFVVSSIKMSSWCGHSDWYHETYISKTNPYLNENVEEDVFKITGVDENVSHVHVLYHFNNDASVAYFYTDREKAERAFWKENKAQQIELTQWTTEERCEEQYEYFCAVQYRDKTVMSTIYERNEHNMDWRSRWVLDTVVVEN